jgi:deferrochelatase/peroxidase EfeB
VTRAFVTVVVPFRNGNGIAERIDACVARLGNPAGLAVRRALGEADLVHFMSIVAVRDDSADTGHLVIEATVDGTAKAGLRSIAVALSGQLRDILAAAGKTGLPKDTAGLCDYLEQHRIEVRPGWSLNNGATFSGAPGMTVNRIKAERALARYLEAQLDGYRNAWSAWQKLEQLRTDVFKHPKFKWAFLPEPAALLEKAPEPSAAAMPMIKAAFRDLILPFLFLPATFLVAMLLGAGLQALLLPGDDLAFLEAAAVAVAGAGLVLGAECLAVFLVLLVAYRAIRQQEDTDSPAFDTVDADRLLIIASLENVVPQNHLAAVSVLKGGWARRLALRLALWAVAARAAYLDRPGYLCDIGSIHSARWVSVPGTDKLLFLSNYDGSWSSYLEDFIALAHHGLSAVWSNTVGFPKTRNLIQKGARDAERFKRWARNQQVPTLFWYSAYPYLSGSRIRTHAQIRHGFATAGEKQAAEWLALFRFARPQDSELQKDSIPTLAFGGLKPLNHAHAFVIRLSTDPVACQEWLRRIEGKVWYGEEKPEGPVFAMGLSATGVAKLLRDKEALRTFPAPFQHGMAKRAAMLGDTGSEAPQSWRWGGQGEVDALLMIYAGSAEALKHECSEQDAALKRLRHGVVREIPLKALPARNGKLNEEPFGFAEGVSQPIMRGASRWVQQRKSIHIVEPGELVLGYRDNLGFTPPLPRDGDFELGRNGTYLVVRQLEQDVGAFKGFLAEAAKTIAGHAYCPAYPTVPLEEWIAAKMVGRWKNGSSLVRHPDGPGTGYPDNDFLFGAEDPEGLRCPFGSHIRRANPRDSFEPNSPSRIAITNRHRIFRVGRAYEAHDGLKNPGILFMCVNADIEGQFEFLQQTWIGGPGFHGMADETDPAVAYRGAGDAFTIPTGKGPMRIRGLRDFVRTLGGGYFFMPGREALHYLCTGHSTPASAPAAKPVEQMAY